jgi:hypothetical protein
VPPGTSSIVAGTGAIIVADGAANAMPTADPCAVGMPPARDCRRPGNRDAAISASVAP